MWPSVVGVSRPCLAFRPCPIFPLRRGPCARPWTGAWCERDVGSTQREPRPPTPSRRRARRHEHNLTKRSDLRHSHIRPGSSAARPLRSPQPRREPASPQPAHPPHQRATSEDVPAAIVYIFGTPGDARGVCRIGSDLVVDQKILCVLDSQNASGKSQKPRLDQSSPGSGRRPARDRRPSE